MNVSHFISISSAVLLTWLGVTYFHQVPHDRYPRQNRYDAKASAENEATKEEEPITATVSLIHE